MKNLLVIVLFLSVTGLNAQVGNIKGKVTDKETGELLLYANVSVYKNGNFVTDTQTDFEGNYLINRLDTGIYDIEVSYFGYIRFLEKKVNILKGKTVLIDIEMNVESTLTQTIVVKTYRVPLIEQDICPAGISTTPKKLGSIKGKVADKSIGELLLYANIAVYKDGNLVTGGQTDFDGNYQIDSLEVGIYDVEASYVGYLKGRIEGLKIFEEKMIEVNVEMNMEGVIRETVSIIIYHFPIVNTEETRQGQIFGASEIEKLPTKNIGEMTKVRLNSIGGMIRNQRFNNW